MYWNARIEAPETGIKLINRNMRCIEISIMGAVKNGTLSRLIETWDVLKCNQSGQIPLVLGRLIETWDVLKSS